MNQEASVVKEGLVDADKNSNKRPLEESVKENVAPPNKRASTAAAAPTPAICSHAKDLQATLNAQLEREDTRKVAYKNLEKSIEVLLQEQRQRLPRLEQKLTRYEDELGQGLNELQAQNKSLQLMVKELMTQTGGSGPATTSSASPPPVPQQAARKPFPADLKKITKQDMLDSRMFLNHVALLWKDHNWTRACMSKFMIDPSYQVVEHFHALFASTMESVWQQNPKRFHPLVKDKDDNYLFEGLYHVPPLTEVYPLGIFLYQSWRHFYYGVWVIFSLRPQMTTGELLLLLNRYIVSYLTPGPGSCGDYVEPGILLVWRMFEVAYVDWEIQRQQQQQQ